LRRQLEASSAAATDQTPKEPDETQLNDVREYAPEVGAHIERQKAEIERLRALVPPAPPPAKAYVPDVLDDTVQEAVDENETLSDWHTLAEHRDKWEQAVAFDTALRQKPEWKDRPLKDRLAAVVALVQTPLADPSKAPAPAPALDAAQRAIAAAAASPAAPVTLGDLRGGATPASVSPMDPYQMVKAGKTDEEIMASLPQL